MLTEIEEVGKELGVPILIKESAVFLKQLIALSKPKRTLEFGTGIGYSGHIILSSGSTQLDTVEINEERISIAGHFFTKNHFDNRVRILKGDEKEIVQALHDTYDFIFLDGAKSNYIKLLPFIKKILNKGGILLADNILFKKAADKHKTILKNLNLFLNELQNESEWLTSVIDIGDGLSLSIKL